MSMLLFFIWETQAADYTANMQIKLHLHNREYKLEMFPCKKKIKIRGRIISAGRGSFSFFPQQKRGNILLREGNSTADILLNQAYWPWCQWGRRGPHVFSVSKHPAFPDSLGTASCFFLMQLLLLFPILQNSLISSSHHNTLTLFSSLHSRHSTQISFSLTVETQQ